MIRLDCEWDWKSFLIGYEYRTYLKRHLFHFGFFVVWLMHKNEVRCWGLRWQRMARKKLDV
jgi:hypothetical protein